jgi:transcriptional regulator with XRE-family HTH domain
MVDIKRLAAEMRLKQQELGEIMGITQPQVSAIMQGKKPLLEVHEIRLKARFGNKIDKYTTDQPVSQGGEDATLSEADLNNSNTMKKYLDQVLRQNEELIRQNGVLLDLFREERAKNKGEVALKKEG